MAKKTRRQKSDEHREKQAALRAYVESTEIVERPPAPLTEGVKHDEGKLRFDLLPPEVLVAVVRVLTHGAEKYEPRNWERGIHYGRCYAALQRHLNAWWLGQELDDDSKEHHLAHAMCMLMFLLAYEMRGTADAFDDRPNYRDPSVDMRMGGDI